MSTTRPPLNSPDIPRLDPVLAPGHTYASVTDKIAAVVLTRPLGIGWLAGFTLAFTVVMVLFASLAWLIVKGVGIWGINIPIGWGFAIVNFVWWIGIGHAGTLISGNLIFAESKVAYIDQPLRRGNDSFCRSLRRYLPLIHTGRPWMAYYHVPVSKYDGNLAAIPEPADLGRLCGIDVRHGFLVVLVCWITA